MIASRLGKDSLQVIMTSLWDKIFKHIQSHLQQGQKIIKSTVHAEPNNMLHELNSIAEDPKMRNHISIQPSFVNKCSVMSIPIMDLRLYCELLRQCIPACLDYNTLWNLMRPIFDLALQLTNNHNNDMNNSETFQSPSRLSESTKYIVQLLLRAAGCLLSLLSSILNQPATIKNCASKSNEGLSNDTRASINGVLVQCSESFGETKWWFCLDNMYPSECNAVLSSLRTLGIIGFMKSAITIAEASNADKMAIRKHQKGMVWPFNALESIQGAYIRMGKRVNCPNLFLMIKTKNDINDIIPLLHTNTHTQHKRLFEDDIIPAEPILDYLNDDTLIMIISFIGYKKLRSLSLTCRHLHTLGSMDLLWYKHYFRRFDDALQDENNFPKDISSNIKKAYIDNYCYVRKNSISISGEPHNFWKKEFFRKWEMEKKLTIKFDANGWKYRTCPHVGCMTILRTPEKFKFHLRKHSNDVKRRIEILIRKQENKEKKEACIRAKENAKVMKKRKNNLGGLNDTAKVSNLEREIKPKPSKRRKCNLEGKYATSNVTNADEVCL
eukprot:CAMPEP_0184873558 /NCGR_PEP_ID=MMETSP0580-20130426/41913_1 /TAXON_ID=1118495 /ORGANISM="Dactyliosolen fragilissimus" /LENGTH=552 /DNA_ID=CAMNT_0027376481 /DNA_START=1459 /DNA_END=3117 /DNA_ORIENTATION=-